VVEHLPKKPPGFKTKYCQKIRKKERGEREREREREREKGKRKGKGQEEKDKPGMMVHAYNPATMEQR
jgi:hypothetical protein